MMTTGTTGWVPQEAADGRTYWFNGESGASTWEDPAAAAAAPAGEPLATGEAAAAGDADDGAERAKVEAGEEGTPLPLGGRKASSAGPLARSAAANTDISASWRQLTSASNGRKYYYNAVTKVSTYDIPADFAEYMERTRDPAAIDPSTLPLKFTDLLREKVRAPSRPLVACEATHPNARSSFL